MQKFVWTNPYLPQTLQISVLIAYFSSGISLLFSLGALNLFVLGFIALTVLGAFGIANVRWWGYIISVFVALLPFLLGILSIIEGSHTVGSYFEQLFFSENIIGTIFNLAILILLIHPMSWNYVKRNFEKTIP